MTLLRVRRTPLHVYLSLVLEPGVGVDSRVGSRSWSNGPYVYSVTLVWEEVKGRLGGVESLPRFSSTGTTEDGFYV